MLEGELIVEFKTVHVRRKYYKLTKKGKAIFLHELERYNEAVELAKKRGLFGSISATRLAFVYD